MYIAISGNMGSGKTTLTHLLARHYGWTPRFETVEDNPYLSDYYRDIARWSLNMEVFFLKERFRDLLEIARERRTIVQDRSIFEGVYVFAANNRDQGNMSPLDFETYMELFENMMTVAKLPDLMIYLRASVPHLVQNIQKRGRDYEQGLSIDYLEGLNRRYEDFVFHKYRGRLLVIEVDHLDYLNNKADFRAVIDRIDAQLFGLFPEEDKKTR